MDPPALTKNGAGKSKHGDSMSGCRGPFRAMVSRYKVLGADDAADILNHPVTEWDLDEGAQLMRDRFRSASHESSRMHCVAK